MTDHAARYLVAKGLDDSPANRRHAQRRTLAAGRLAELGAHLIPGVLETRVVEHGSVDYMSPGNVFALVILDRPAHVFSLGASKLDEDLTALAMQRGLMLTVAVQRATKWDRIRERVRWALHRPARNGTMPP